MTQTTATGWVSVYPDGKARPSTSSLNFVRGKTVPNLVIVPVGANGDVDLFNGSSGTVQLLADVTGYFVAGSPSSGGAFGALTPSRVLDTRSGTGASRGAVGPGYSTTLTVEGHDGVPTSGVSAVVLNITVTQPTTGGWVSAYGTGTGRPATSNLNFVAGQTVANAAIVPLGTDGAMTIYNGSSGGLQLVADVSGYFLSGDATNPGAFHAVEPTRLMDSRVGLAIPGPFAPFERAAVQISGSTAVPSGASAAVLNLTVTQPAAPGYVTVYPDGESPPSTSSLNFGSGQTVPNLVVTGLGANGRIDLFNGSQGNVQLIADASGYFK
ncbi:hypothetical protein [Pedococcus sp. 5OH_020]|uniref:hypothetical protein n=1 Tax=Pedococcus sp. 5OH_020 TaxID=2989814 RepID=UPI0022EA07B9|nr:hypothetical protein [Pedococcus sp. 5OH_020]